MKRMVTVLVLACTSFFLQACGTSYVQPEGEDVAFLTIRNRTNGELKVMTFRNAADCSGGLVDLAPERHVHSRGELNIKVKPDEPFSFYASYSLGDDDCKLTATSSYCPLEVDCRLTVSFVPKAASYYTAYYSVNSSDGKCYMPILVRTTWGETREPSFKLRQSQTPFTPAGRYCW